MKLYKIMFLNSMIIGTLISISSYSWLSAWIGLEINLLSIIPLLVNMKNKFPSEAALKYFIAQSMASSMFLFSVITFLNMNNSLEEKFNTIESMLMSMALLMKMGAAPFHFWFPEVLSGLNWMNLYIMMTWQKIAPLMLLTYHISINMMFFSIIIILSSMISGLLGLNQICMRKILAYSSINHVGWMIASLMNSTQIFFYYFIIYSIINLNIILLFKSMNIFFLNQLCNILNHMKNLKFFFMLNFLSLGGLPPFLGFFPKWLTINNMIDNKHYTITCILIIFTLISLFFYLRITFSTFTIFNEETLLISFKKINFLYFFINFIALSGLIMCCMAYSIF